jgi:hypothetical protein
MHSLAPALGGGESSNSCPRCFMIRQIAPSSTWIGGRVGHRANLEESLLLLGIELQFLKHPASSLVTRDQGLRKYHSWDLNKTRFLFVLCTEYSVSTHFSRRVGCPSYQIGLTNSHVRVLPGGRIKKTRLHKCVPLTLKVEVQLYNVNSCATTVFEIICSYL